MKLASFLFLFFVSLCNASYDPWLLYENRREKENCPVIPEPATYVQVGGMLIASSYVMYIRRKNNKSS